MLSTTLGDELKMATGGQAKVCTVSMKDRGPSCLRAMVRMVRLVYGKELGHFVSSTYYGESLPDWLIELHRPPVAKR